MNDSVGTQLALVWPRLSVGSYMGLFPGTLNSWMRALHSLHPLSKLIIAVYYLGIITV